MSKKVYPVGTKIRYKRHSGFCSEELHGMTGKVIAVVGGFPLIYLPKANFVSEYSTKERPATVQTNWDAIEPLVVKNQQLEFAFMEK